MYVTLLRRQMQRCQTVLITYTHIVSATASGTNGISTDNVKQYVLLYCTFIHFCDLRVILHSTVPLPVTNIKSTLSQVHCSITEKNNND